METQILLESPLNAPIVFGEKALHILYGLVTLYIYSNREIEICSHPASACLLRPHVLVEGEARYEQQEPMFLGQNKPGLGGP
jgi:hypothetical protein